MFLAQGPQRSDPGEAQTRSPSVSSQALYHWATALPTELFKKQCDKYMKYMYHGWSNRLRLRRTASSVPSMQTRSLERTHT